MNKDEILKKAQNAKQDERTEAMTTKAHKLAGNIGILFACIVALIIIIDGYIFESGRTYDFLTVAFLLIGVGAVNNVVFSFYQLLTLKKYSRIADIIVFGGLAVSAVVKFIAFFHE